MKHFKLIQSTTVFGILALSSVNVAAEDAISLLGPNGGIVGLIQTDSGHVYNRDHTLLGDPGFEDNVYEIKVSAANIKKRNVITAWVFCMDADKQRIGSNFDGNNRIMGSRLDGIIGATVLEDKVHLGVLCGLKNTEVPSFVEVVVVDHGKPVNGVYRDESGKEVQGAMLQLMSRPEDDPFCTGVFTPERKCRIIGSGIAPLHRHHKTTWQDG